MKWLFEIAGKPVSENEYLAFRYEYKSQADAVWYDYTAAMLQQLLEN
jgi:hypothetical protein